MHPQQPPTTPAASRTPKQRLKMAVAWTFGLALLAWLLSHTPFSQVKDALLRPSPWVWALTLSGLAWSYALRAARLQVVLDLDGADRPTHPTQRFAGIRGDALRVILMHNAAINLLPMRAGELSFPWLASKELGLPVSRAVACLLWMRVQDLLILLGLGALLWPSVPLTWRVAALLAMIFGAWLGHAWLQRWHSQHANSSMTEDAGSASWRLKIRHLLHRVGEALLEPAHHKPSAWLLTLANWSVKLGAGAFLLAAITQSNWLAAWIGALGGELAAVIPLQGPAGFGTYEAGVWLGMAAHHAPGTPQLALAVTAALALHVCFVLCAVMAGASAWVLGHLQKSHSPQLPDRPSGNP